MSRNTCLIIGGKSKLGLSIAEKFSSNNFNVILAGRGISSLVEIKKNIEIEAGNKCELIDFDILNFNDHKQFTNKIININKQLRGFSSSKQMPDVIICVVGKMIKRKNQKDPYEEIKEEMLANYVGPAMLIELMANEIQNFSENCTIIGVSSVAGERGRASNYTYGSAKSGFTQYLSGLRQKLNQKKISVTTIVPGYIDTQMLENVDAPEFLTSSPEQVAELIFNSYKSNKDVVFTRYWRYIMLAVKLIPEFIFKKINL